MLIVMFIKLQYTLLDITQKLLLWSRSNDHATSNSFRLKRIINVSTPSNQLWHNTHKKYYLIKTFSFLKSMN